MEGEVDPAAHPYPGAAVQLPLQAEVPRPGVAPYTPGGHKMGTDVPAGQYAPMGQSVALTDPKGQWEPKGQRAGEVEFPVQ